MSVSPLGILRTLLKGQGRIATAAGLFGYGSVYFIAYLLGFPIHEVQDLLLAAGLGTAASAAIVDDLLGLSVTLHDLHWTREIELAKNDYTYERADPFQVALRITKARHQIAIGPGRKWTWSEKRQLKDWYGFQRRAIAHGLLPAIDELGRIPAVEEIEMIVDHLTMESKREHDKLGFAARLLPGSRDRATRKLLPP
jgi:hypothetical protein